MADPTGPPPFHTPNPREEGSRDDTNNHDGPEDNSPNLQELILGHVASLTELIKKHNAQGGNALKPIRLDFGDEGDKVVEKGKGVEDNDDLRKPFKEVSRSPFTRRIIEFSGDNYVMPLNMRFYDGSTDPNDHLTRFTEAANQGQWPMPLGALCSNKRWMVRPEDGSNV
jgi:hypothetical protein